MRSELKIQLETQYHYVIVPDIADRAELPDRGSSLCPGSTAVHPTPDSFTDHSQPGSACSCSKERALREPNLGSKGVLLEILDSGA